MNNDLSIQQGTISFWTRENQVIFNDGKITPLFSVNPTGGSIFIIKDDDNKLKIFYIVLGKGRIDMEYDVSKLDSSKKHMIAVTWKLDDKKLVLYIDDQVAGTKDIPF